MGVWEDEGRPGPLYTAAPGTGGATRRVSGVRRSGAGARPGPDAEVFQTELSHITETMLEISAEYGAVRSAGGNRELNNPAGLFLQSRPSTIYAGSNEKFSGISWRRRLELPRLIREYEFSLTTDDVLGHITDICQRWLVDSREDHRK